VWEGILKATEVEGVKPIGLAARDSLRFEACMPLYGHEINAELTPSRLAWASPQPGEAFHWPRCPAKTEAGRTRESPGGFRNGRAWRGARALSGAQGWTGSGHVTSGMFAPHLDRYLGMAYVPTELATIGTEIDVLIRNKPVKAKIVKRPFYVPATGARDQSISRFLLSTFFEARCEIIKLNIKPATASRKAVAGFPYSKTMGEFQNARIELEGKMQVAILEGVRDDVVQVFDKLGGQRARRAGAMVIAVTSRMSRLPSTV